MSILRGEAFSRWAPAGVVHGFTTRQGPGQADLDLGDRGTQSDWAWVATQMDMRGAPVAMCRQVHGSGILTVTDGGVVGEGDAMVSNRDGVLLAIRVADCVPVLLAHSNGVAAIHAGWRGLVAGVIPAAVVGMRVSDDCCALVGPAIGLAHYEVGEEVVEAIATTGCPQTMYVDRTRGERPHVDLRAVARWQLAQAGFKKVEVLPHCTYSEQALHSFRRDGVRSGRIAAVIGVRTERE